MATDHHMHLHVYTAMHEKDLSRLVNSDDLFDIWPLPAEMEGRLDQDDIEHIKAEMRGQPMSGPRPNSKELKTWGLTCVEHIYDTYWCW